MSASTGAADVVKQATSIDGPLFYLWNNDYYRRVMNAAPDVDPEDMTSVVRRIAESVLLHLRDDEQQQDAGVVEVPIRKVDASTDSDLLAINPNAYYVASVAVVNGKGEKTAVPVVYNRTNSTDVDPRLRL